MSKVELTLDIYEVGRIYLSVLETLKSARQENNSQPEKAIDSALGYLAQGVPGKTYFPWNKILSEVYGTLKPTDPFFIFIKDTNFLVGLYEILVWGEGQMGCPSCKEHVPAFLRVIDGDEGITCNYCWFEPPV